MLSKVAYCETVLHIWW